ncbi:unnamed protein product [Cyprideis torosa]|uniref:Uncharacterized protein n=1 Tax=Cyprideis torosa TaxID=163714 RepID=A0A7R8VZZ3_9CRUS|nr:unnamed protein product [Cyprideis torosa]CAG0879011.1 unnamed protein product [Cyprideis torosa]
MALLWLCITLAPMAVISSSPTSHLDYDNERTALWRTKRDVDFDGVPAFAIAFPDPKQSILYGGLGGKPNRDRHKGTNFGGFGRRKRSLNVEDYDAGIHAIAFPDPRQSILYGGLSGKPNKDRHRGTNFGGFGRRKRSLNVEDYDAGIHAIAFPDPRQSILYGGLSGKPNKDRHRGTNFGGFGRRKRSLNVEDYVGGFGRRKRSLNVEDYDAGIHAIAFPDPRQSILYGGLSGKPNKDRHRGTNFGGFGRKKRSVNTVEQFLTPDINVDALHHPEDQEWDSAEGLKYDVH